MPVPCQQSDLKEFPFTQDEIADLWRVARTEFIDKPEIGPDGKPILGKIPDFDSVVKGVANLTGLDERFIVDAFTKPKGIREVTNEMWSKINARRSVVSRARQAIAEVDRPGFTKALSFIYNAPRALLVAGHWGVFPVTHAGDIMFDPVNTAKYLKTVKRAWVNSNPADYQVIMQNMVRDPDYVWARRGSPSVDPRTAPVGILGKNYSADVLGSKLKPIAGAIQKVTQWSGEKSGMGFDMLKPLRLELFKKEWGRVVREDWGGKIPSMKEGVAAARNIMAVIDHATGEIRLSPAASRWSARFLFAPKLLPARWMSGMVDPIKAIGTYARWDKASAGERAAARFVMRRTLRTMATYHVALAINEGLNQYFGSDDHVNFTHPERADFLRFKILGHTVYYPSGIMEPFRLFAAAVAAAYRPIRERRAESAETAVGEVAWRYALGKVHPTIGLASEAVFGQEHFTGKKLPAGISDMPWQPYTKATRFKPQIGWGEFLGSKAPIPLAGGVREFYNMLRHEGMSAHDSLAYIRAALSAGIEATGWQAPPFREPSQRIRMGAPREPSEPMSRYMRE